MLNLFVSVASLLVKGNREVERYDISLFFWGEKKRNYKYVAEYALITNMSVLFLILLYFYIAL